MDKYIIDHFLFLNGLTYTLRNRKLVDLFKDK